MVVSVPDEMKLSNLPDKRLNRKALLFHFYIHCVTLF